MSDHVGNADRRVFVAGRAVLRDAHAGHTAGVHNTSQSRLAGCFQDAAGSFDVGLIQLPRIERAQPVVRRDMEKRIAAGQRRSSEARSLRLPSTTVRGRCWTLRRSEPLRASALTSHPSRMSARATAAPTNPVAPVTNAFMTAAYRMPMERANPSWQWWRASGWQPDIAVPTGSKGPARWVRGPRRQ